MFTSSSAIIDLPRVFGALLLLAFLLAPSPSRADGAAVTLPSVLTEKDAGLYQKIFAVQEKGDWKKADQLIKQLSDPILMGHVKAQRYLHPTKYRSVYKELKDWMKDYADLHYAEQIYKLALRRKPKNWNRPRAPLPSASLNRVVIETADTPPSQKSQSAKQRRLVRAYMWKIRGHLRRGWTKSVKNLIESHEIKKLFPQIDYDRAQARLAFGYFVDGRDEWAIQWAEKAIKGSGRWVPEARWTAGLANWRLGRFAAAAGHFEAMADGANQSSWTVSQAAFWAARAHLVARNPERVTSYLEMAAAHPETFYGILARRLLGLPSGLSWEEPPLNEDIVSHVMEVAAGRRALALLQIGKRYEAEREFRLLAGRSEPEFVRDLLGFAGRANMAGLALRLNDRLYERGQGFASASYPIPKWEPNGGFDVDPALVYAVARQESKFNPRAKSGAGARGLMQLMPRTAGFVARDRRFYRTNEKRSTLFEPEVSMTLGQKYIRTLLEDDKIEGNLFYMAAAWNGGPGNLNKWRRRTDYQNDALFFIESIPSGETRNFIERVLANLWIYRDRFGEARPSLDAVAAGNWPQYQSQAAGSASDKARAELATPSGIPPQ